MAVANIHDIPGDFPPLDELSADAFKKEEAGPIARTFAERIYALLTKPQDGIIEDLLHPGAFWRDKVALTWSLRTFYPASVIAETIPALLLRAAVIPASVKLVEEQVAAVGLPNGVSLIRAPFTFATSSPNAQCTAVVKLIRLKNGDIKVFTVTTSLKELDAVPWGPADAPAETSVGIPGEVDVLVVGGGHAGLSISAYLKALGINFAMVERDPEIGDSWGKRYDSLTLHTTRVYSGLPFVGFPREYPEYVPAELIARYYADYVKKLSLPAYTNRECVSAVWDAEKDAWNVILKGANGTETMRARAIVFAAGNLGRFPLVPDIPGKATFEGISLHSADYTSAAQWVGKRVAIIGAGTTACDIALDCVGAGAEATIVQRSSTRIFVQKDVTTLLLRLWNDENPVEMSDTIGGEDPIVLTSSIAESVFKLLKQGHDPDFYPSLERAGFRATSTESFQHQVYIRGGSLYTDIGACAAISRGEIKVKSGASIDSITPTGLAFSDGTTLEADVIVYCTGFEKDARKMAAGIVGPEIAEALEPVWGLDVRMILRESGRSS